MDNLSIHWYRATAKLLQEQRMEVVFNPAYSPFANPIEDCFSVVKLAFTKAKINRIVNESKDSNDELIEKAFEKVNINLVKACVRHSNLLIA